MGTRTRRAFGAVLWALAACAPAAAFPQGGGQSVLPAGTDFAEEALHRPREVFKSEQQGGLKSYLVNLGDLAFNSPTIFGGAARQAGMSCGTCHVNGAGNGRLFVPGMSTRRGNFDTTGPLFNPPADNHVLDPVRIPSLRGARFLAPYGHDGRVASLREFVRNVIVGEFAGAEPSPAILDAIVAYINDIDFLPNPRLAHDGKLTDPNPAEQRGAALFNKPFPHDPQLSCAACHVPSGAFIDHAQHDVGSGGMFRTPTLRNADFNAPYFHDGRFDTYDQVIDHFDRTYDLGLTPRDRTDLVAYLTAIGNGILPYEPDSIGAQMKELDDFVSVLDTAISTHDVAVVKLTVDTIGRELRELTEKFPDIRDRIVRGGDAERRIARNSLKDLVLSLRRIDLAAAAGHFDAAAAELMRYRKLAFAAVPLAMQTAQPWSLFNPAVRQAHYSALRDLLQTAHQLPR
ncbi:MAG TPA: cytochrome c peroxidase [Xanthobacteraceae bacterium]|jgi:cytochrome c peroxidase